MIFLLILSLLVPSLAFAQTGVGVAQSAAPTINGGTQDLTVSGFGTPVCAMFFAGYGTANGTAVDHAMMAMGFADFTNGQSVAGASEDNLITSDTGTTSGTSVLRTLLNTDQTTDGTATAATITNGVRLTWADAPPTAYLVNTVMFNSNLVSNCFVGSLAGSVTLNGTASTTSPGFQPDLVLILVEHITSSNRISVGWAVNDGGVVQRSAGMSDNNAAASMDVSGVIRSDRVAVNSTTSTGASLEFTSFDANGFTLTTRDNGLSLTARYMAIKFANGLRAKVTTCATPTATGASSCTGVGWTPQAGLFMLTESAAVGTYYNTDNGEVFGLSGFTASNQYASSEYTEDSDGTSNTESITDSKPVRLRKDSLDFIVATLTGFQSDGADFNYSTTSGTARQFGALWFEAPASTRRRIAPMVFQ